MGAINKSWHQANRMPVKPSEDERGRWHDEHQRACACRAPSEKELEVMARWRAKQEN